MRHTIKRTLCLALASLLLLGTLSGCSSEPTYDDCISQAEDHIDDLNFGLAIDLLEQAIDLDDEDEEAYLLLGQLYLDMDMDDDAIDILEEGYDATDDDDIYDLLVKLGVFAKEATTTTADTSKDSTTSSSSSTTESTTSTATEAADTETIELYLATTYSRESPEGLALAYLCDSFEAATDGRYVMQLCTDEQFGTDQDLMDAVQSGYLHLVLVSNDIVEAVNSDFSILSTPYVFDSMEHVEDVFTSGILDDLFASTANDGFQVLAGYCSGGRNMYTNLPIYTPSDLSGQKIRIPENTTLMEMMTAWGANALTLSVYELYAALQQGTVDGAEGTIFNYIDRKLYELTCCYSETNHLYIPDELLVNSDFLASMSAADRSALIQCVQDSMTFMFDYAEIARDEYYAMAQNYGVEIIQADTAAFKATMADTIAQAANQSSTTRAIYDAIQSLA